MGNDLGRPVGPAIRRREMSVNDTSADRSKQFLADLGKAMHSTAEAARLAATDECRSNAQAYTEYLRANSEGASLHKAAAADITAIRDLSKAEMERTRQETEKRISQRNELLEEALRDYTSAVDLEIERVQQSVQGFEDELARFFEQLLHGDPTDFATMAANVPDPPEFPEPDPEALVHVLRLRREQLLAIETSPETSLEASLETGPETSPETSLENGPEPSPETSPDGKEVLPDHWWLDSPATLAARTQSTPE
jgi:hypothetical protein